MGLILDTSVLIDAERRLLDLDQMLEELIRHKEDECALSSVSLMELSHGVVRAKTDELRRIRQSFLDDLRAAVPTIPVMTKLAIRAGELDGSLRRIGITIGAADSIIAATALHVGYGVATLNVKHFKLVPGLDVMEM